MQAYKLTRVPEAVANPDKKTNLEAFVNDEKAFALAVISIESDEQAKKFIDDLADCKKLTETLKRFSHLRQKVVALENKTYIELFNRGFRKALQNTRRQLPDACSWANGLLEDDLQEILSGETTLMSAYRAHMKQERLKESAKTDKVYRDYFVSKCPDVRKEIVNDYLRDGSVNISRSAIDKRFEHIPSVVPASFITDFIDGTKDALLRAGAYGVGQYEYVDLERSDRVADVLSVRIKGIVQDISSIASIIEKAKSEGYYIAPLEIRNDNSGNMLDELSIVYMALLMMPHTRNSVRWSFETEKVKDEVRAAFDAILTNTETGTFPAQLRLSSGGDEHVER